MLLLGNVVFVAYDRLITRMLIIYEYKWRDKIKRILK